MASLRWLGKALARPEIQTLTLSGTWTAGDTITLSIPSLAAGKTITVTLGTTVTNTQIALELVTIWNEAETALGAAYLASERGVNIPEFAEVEATASGSTVIFTGRTDGVPFTLAVARTTATSGAVSLATTQAATGPNHWDNAINWDTGIIPANTDSVYLDKNAVPIKYGLAQTGVTLAYREIGMSYEADIGLPELNVDGAEYVEYRPRKLAIKVTADVVGRGEGNGGQWRLDSSTAQTALTIEGSASSSEDNLPAIQWIGTHASNALTVRGNASFGAAMLAAEVATIATLTADGQAVVKLGAGVTLSGALAVKGSASLTINSAVATSLTASGQSTTTIEGTGAVALAVAREQAVINYNTSGTLGGACVVSDQAVLNFDGDPRAKAVTNPIDVFGAGRVIDNKKVATGLILDFNECIGDVSQLGSNVRLTRAAVA